MSIFSKFLKGLGFEEDQSTKKVKNTDKKQKDVSKNSASFDLSAETYDEPQVQDVTSVKDEVLANNSNENVGLDIVKVESQAQVQTLVDRLVKGEKILLNLSGLEKEDMIRSLDFLSGAVYALGISMQKVDTAVYLIQ